MTTLALIDKGTGEIVDAVDAAGLLAAAGIVDIEAATVEQLVEFIGSADELRQVAAEAKGEVGDELIARMDRDGKWTFRTKRFELTSLSPEAGTVGYDIDLLRDALATLVATGVISYAGSHAALEPVHPTVPVSYKFLRHVLSALDGYETADDIFEEVHRLLLTEPDLTYKVRLAGVNALLKIPDARDAIEACRIKTQPRRRVVNVKRA